MKLLILQKWNDRRGINRLVAIFLVIVAALLAALAVPVYRHFKSEADEYACSLAVSKAQDLLDNQYLQSGWTEATEAEAAELVERSTLERDGLCPAGGDFYILHDESRMQSVVVVCALHEEDLLLRTRLNAGGALKQLRDAVELDRSLSRGDPDTVALTLNSKSFTAERAEELPDLWRGTYSTAGYKGTVIAYVLDDEGVSAFCYADEDHCARWVRDEGWAGDSYPEP